MYCSETGCGWKFCVNLSLLCDSLVDLAILAVFDVFNHVFMHGRPVVEFARHVQTFGRAEVAESMNV